ncbi:MAG: hypothetical protein AAF560_03430 [Acidobacteriota bacterium]
MPWLPLAIAGAACALYLLAELYVLSGLALPLDDSWIHLQFARQIAAGDGLSFNPGERITGSTAPLWTALLSLGFVLPGSPVWWAKVFGVACFLGTVIATQRLASELGASAGLSRFAAAMTAASHWLVWSALSGMEITLFACASLWGIVLHLRERRDPARAPASLAILAAACLARPEGCLLIILALADRLVRFDGEDPEHQLAARRKILKQVASKEMLIALGAVAIILLPTWFFYWTVGGSILPTTFAVKSGPMGDLIPSGRYLSAVLDVLFRSQPMMLLLAGAGALRLLERLGGPRDRGLLPAAWPLGMALVYSLLAPPTGAIVVGNFGRYYFPVLPVIVVLGVLGLEEAARRLSSTQGAVVPRRLLRLALVIALIAPQAWSLFKGPPRYLQTLTNVEDSDVAAARWLAERLPADALLAVQDIGALKYHLPNRVVDLTGIVNPEILPVLRGSGPTDPTYWEDRLLSYLERVQPDYLVVFPRSYPRLTRSEAGFRSVKSFKIPHNVTMAGSELVIFSTPWARHPLHQAASDG